MTPTLYTSAFSAHHDTGAGHPENADRITALEAVFQTPPFQDWPQKIATPAELDCILLAHEEDYIFTLQDKTPDNGLVPLDGDTVLSPSSYDAALHAAGAVINAVDDVMNGETNRAFCAVRPPGHHAEPHKAMGFCLMNNIFIGARHAQETYDIKKIAIIDFDVHHGNGTDTMCRRHNAAHPDAPIFYISTHGHPLFPGTGNPDDNDATTLNLYLPDKCDGESFKNIYNQHVFPALNAFKPEILMISAGFDAHMEDSIANCALNSSDYAWITQKLGEISSKYCKNRIISVLEGGYNIPALTQAVKAHLQELQA